MWSYYTNTFNSFLDKINCVTVDTDGFHWGCTFDWPEWFDFKDVMDILMGDWAKFMRYTINAIVLLYDLATNYLYVDLEKLLDGMRQRCSDAYRGRV